MTDSPIVFNFAEFSQRDLATELRELKGDVAVRLLGVDGAPPPSSLCSGLSEHLSISVQGSVGDFLFLLGAEASIDVHGNAGDCVGHSMVSGRVMIRGNTGNFTGAYATGGFIVVLGQAGAFCGMGLTDADLVVRSKVGSHAALEMRSGTLVLGNGAGENLGMGMTGGVIYVRGEVKSKCPGLRSVRMKDADSMRLSLLLARSGIKANASDFKVFRSRLGE